MAFKTAKMIFSAIPLAAGMVFLLFPFSHANEVGRHGSPAARFQSQTDSTPLTPLEKRLIREGLVNVQALDPTIIVDLKYAREDSFMGKAVYGDFNRAYLRPSAARKLAKASEILQSRFRNLRILVGDALRPRSVQRKMWELVVNTPMQRYVANPATGSMHNYGAAVDVTLYDVMTGKRLDMGTPLDHSGPLAQPAMEARYLRSGKLTKTQVANRVILRNAMLNAGWRILRIEWWHFNAFPKHYVRKHYAIVE